MQKPYAECCMKLRDWIDPMKLDATYLAENPMLWHSMPPQTRVAQNTHTCRDDWTLDFGIEYGDYLINEYKPKSGYWGNHAAQSSLPKLIATVLAGPRNLIDWMEVAGNPYPPGVEMLRDNLHVFDNSPYIGMGWYDLSKNENPRALEILQQQQDKIFWSWLSRNPVIFRDEYEPVARQYFREHVAAELMARVWHPRNAAKFAGWGVDISA